MIMNESMSPCLSLAGEGLGFLYRDDGEAVPRRRGRCFLNGGDLEGQRVAEERGACQGSERRSGWRVRVFDTGGKGFFFLNLTTGRSNHAVII